MSAQAIGEVREAVRRWSRNRTVALTIAGTLALGLAPATAMVALVDQVLLRPLPWPNADRLVAIHAVLPQRRNDPGYLKTWAEAPVSWEAWKGLQRTAAFHEVGAWYSDQQFLGADTGDVVQVIYGSSSFFSVIGIHPFLGRLFTADEDSQETDVAVLTYDAWKNRFGGRTDVVGQAIVLSPLSGGAQATKTIVGVLPSTARFPKVSPDVIVPIGLMAWNGSFETNRFLRVIALLKPRVSIEAATSEADQPVRGFESPEQRRSRVVPLSTELRGHLGGTLALILVAAAFFLAIALLNVSGLLLITAQNRSREFAIRLALGSSKAGIVRLLIIENVLLSIAAIAAALIIASWLLPILLSFLPAALHDAERIHLSFPVALASVMIGLATTVFFGVVPVFNLIGRTGGHDLQAADLRKRPRRRIHEAVMVGQLGLTLVLLVCSGLLARETFRLLEEPIGFDPSNLVVVQMRIPVGDAKAPLPKSEMTTAAPRQILEAFLVHGWLRVNDAMQQLKALPGVTAVAATSSAPMIGPVRQAAVRTLGATHEHQVHRQVITESYFATLGIRILEGRSFSPHDRQRDSVAIVSKEFDRRFFQVDARPKQFRHGTRTYEVIGVASDVKHAALDEAAVPTFYVLNRLLTETTYFVVRSSAPASTLFPLAQPTLRSAGIYATVTASGSMESLLDRSTTKQRLQASVTLILSVGALALAALGFSVLTARLVTERRHEIAIRIAIGASQRRVWELVLRRLFVITGIAISLGIPASLAAVRAIESLLLEMPPLNPTAVGLPVLLLLITTMAATVRPLYSAGRVNPAEALKE